ncbi:hypothetical protein [Sphaerimonospora mesophila]|uniref:hypothetical protein n=1 Tax=Sphaerimonospora mesophila TaxID=37483 RepID=UPI0006E16303
MTTIGNRSTDPEETMTTATVNTADVVELLRAELALIGRTPTPTDVQAVMRFGFTPTKYLILADDRPVRFAINRLAAIVAARSADHLHPEARIEVEYRPTGERAVAGMDGRFVHTVGVYHWNCSAWHEDDEDDCPSCTGYRNHSTEEVA